MPESIKLHDVLPNVFRGMEHEAPLCHSQVWLSEIVLRSDGGNTLIAAESGTGKSSLCSFITGARTDYQGTIEFDGEDIRSFGPGRWADIRCRHIALLPQEMRLFPELTALENIDIKNRLTRWKTPQQIRDMFEHLGIADRIDTPAGRLSVGQQQRVAIIRSICQPFSFLLLDEPVSHLDQRNNHTVATLLQQEATAQGAAIIATSVGNHIKLDFSRTLML